MLKQTFLSSILVATTIVGVGIPALVRLPSNQAFAQTQRFFCDTSGGTPTTVAQTKQQKVVLVRWATTVGGGQYPPLVRCQQVSAKFQSLNEQGRLRFITTRRINGSHVICAAPQKNKPCFEDGQLLTLKPGSDPRKALTEMFRLRVGATGSGLLETSPILHVNLDDCLNAQLENKMCTPAE
jgi:Circadian oscillating protein COP23